MKNTKNQQQAYKEKIISDINFCKDEFARVHSSYQCIYTKIGIVMAVVFGLFVHVISIMDIKQNCFCSCHCFSLLCIFVGAIYCGLFIYLLVLTFGKDLHCPEPWKIDKQKSDCEYWKEIFDEYKECLDTVIREFKGKQKKFMCVLQFMIFGFILHIYLICCMYVFRCVR